MELSTVKKERIEWIDICKFISMILVVALHYGVPSAISKYCHYFHMPVFFFLSGMVFNSKKYTAKELICNRYRTILIPYFIFGIASFIFWELVYFIKDSYWTIGMTDFLKCFLWDCTNPIPNLWGGVQWFLPALFFTELLYLLCSKLNKRLRMIAVIGCFAIGSTIGHFGAENIPWGLAPAFLMITFFYCGNQAKKIESKIKRCPIRMQTALIVGLAVLTLVCAIFNKSVNVRRVSIRNPLLFFLGALSGILMMCLLAMVIDKIIQSEKIRDIMLKWGRNTIIILYFHRWLDGITDVCMEIFHIELNSVVIKYGFNFSLLIVCFVLVIPVVGIINKKIPWIIGRN